MAEHNTNKLETLSQLTEPLTQGLTSKASSWASFLDSAARMYKYSFDEQVLIHAQRPDATACAPMDLWNKTFGRWINKGSKGIALIDKTGAEPRLRYVFDIADTHEGRDRTRPPYIWKMEPEHEALVSETLKAAYNKNFEHGDTEDFKSQILELSKNLVENRDEQNSKSETWTEILSSSVGYVVLSRCGMDASDLTWNFMDINRVSDLVDIGELGEATGEMAREVLSHIENTVKRYDRQKNQTHQTHQKTENINERGVEHGNTVSAGRGLSAARPEIERRDEPAGDEIRTDEGATSERTQEGPVFSPAAPGEADGTPGGHRGDGAGADRERDSRDADARPGAGQSDESDGLGAAHELPAHDGGGSGDQRADLRLNASGNEQSTVMPEQSPTDNSAASDVPYAAGDTVYLDQGKEYRIANLRNDGLIELSTMLENGFFKSSLIMNIENFEQQFYANIFNQSLIAERQAAQQKQSEIPQPQKNEAAAVNEHEQEAPAFTKKWEHSEEDVLSVLRQISDDDEKHLMTFELLRHGDTDERITRTVKRVFGKGKNDIVYPDGARGTELHDENGMRITKEAPDGRPIAVTFMPWDEVAAEIVHLIGGDGIYAAEETDITLDADRRYRAGMLLSKWQREELARGKSLERDLSENAPQGELLSNNPTETSPRVSPAFSATHAVGENVLLPEVYEKGNYNRRGRRTRVTVAEPVGKYQIYTGIEESERQPSIYVMTDSGRLVMLGSTRRGALTEEALDSYFAESVRNVEEALSIPDAWIDFNAAAIANRLQEADEHNDPIRQARDAEYAQEAAERAAEREREALERKQAFNKAVDEIGNSLVNNERVNIPREFDKNPLLELFSLYKVDVPLRTKGWLNQHVNSVQLEENGILRVWGDVKEVTPSFGNAIIELYYAAKLRSPERQREFISIDFEDYFKDVFPQETVYLPPTHLLNGEYNSDGKDFAMAPEKLVGKYQIYTRAIPLGQEENEEYSDPRTAYVMTNSGRLVDCGTLNDGEYDFTEETLDKGFAKAPQIMAETLNDANKLVDYKVAAITNRLQDAEEHNTLVREFRERDHEGEVAHSAVTRKTEAPNIESSSKNMLSQYLLDNNFKKTASIKAKGLTLYASPEWGQLTLSNTQLQMSTGTVAEYHKYDIDKFSIDDQGILQYHDDEPLATTQAQAKQRKIDRFLSHFTSITHLTTAQVREAEEKTEYPDEISREMITESENDFQGAGSSKVKEYLGQEKLKEYFLDSGYTSLPTFDGQGFMITNGKSGNGVHLTLREDVTEFLIPQQFMDLEHSPRALLETNRFYLDTGGNLAYDGTGQEVTAVLSAIQQAKETYLAEQKEQAEFDAKFRKEITEYQRSIETPSPSPTQTPAAKASMATAANYRITDNNLGAGGQKTKYRNNAAAIRTLQTIEAEGRQATPEEQETLSKYAGWGGIPQAFGPKVSRSDAEHKDWQEEYKELKELLTEDEYASARASTLNAHYTSPTVIKAIYETVERMGFTKGNVLEPAMGVGNFFGLMPESMEKSKLYGVELDSITGHIAKQLYPQADISVTGFEKTNWPDNFFDLAVGNVPFGSYKVSDRKYDKHNFLIHDYFFAKTLDQVRPGGVVALVTSKGTMDKANPAVRKHIAERAELLGAVRLPNNAFKANAGTEVTTDILFLQKRERPITIEPDWVHLDKTEDGIPLNSYFAANPHMVLGKMTRDKSMYGNEDETACIPIEGASLAEQLKDALAHVTGQISERNIEDSQANSKDKGRKTIPADSRVKNFSYCLVEDENGKAELYYRENSIMFQPDLPAAAADRAKALVNLRDCARNLIDAQLYSGDEEVKREQRNLNDLYDSFNKKYGLINSKDNAKAFTGDSSYYLLCSLEILDENGKLERKADMFSKRTIRQRIVPDTVDTPSEALALSIAEKAGVDLEYMSGLLPDIAPEDITTALKGVIFPNPEHKDDDGKPRYETADEYLSGNVRHKLMAARQYAETEPELYAHNVTALEAVQPKDLEAHEIDVRLGASWVEPKYVEQFMYELLDTPRWAQDEIKAHYSQHSAAWGIEGKTRDSGNIKANSAYGTERVSAYSIIEDSLNRRDTRIYDTDEDGKSYLNQKETTLAQQKQESIKLAFKDWVFKDPERRHELVSFYNERFNSTRPREYDGSHITFTGINPEISLREHQTNAIARILYGGNTLLAHEVGAGKTFEMIASAMEAKHLGLAQKSLMVVPNHLTEQTASEFMTLYPSANVLIATKKDFETANRKKFCSRIATGDYDAIIIGHSQFERIPLSAERQKAFLDEQIDELVFAINDAKEAKGSRFSIKQMEKVKKNLESKLSNLMAEDRKDDVVTFEELGVDRLYVDEAHMYKNLYLRTTMRNVAGIPQTEAQKSSDMYAKCRYLDEITGNKGVIFATGTPISNSMTEMYTMMRYLQHDTLKELQLQHFDSWASTFGETVNAIELAPEGTGYRAKTRFAKFYNLPELMNTFKEVADVKTASELNLPRPKANYHVVAVKPTEEQKDLIASLSARAADVHNKKVEPNEDNMLKITSDGRKIGLDQRLIDPFLPDDPGSKVNACMENIYRIWDKTKEERSTQLLFCDFSTPGKDKFNVYEDIKTKLVQKGIPEKEIAYIHDADTEVKKKELFAKVRKGQVRVLMGSTAKMGSGTNVQNKLIALHDLDCPWRPADLEQRAGRIVRQGNKNAEVDIYRYVTVDTFDSYLFQTIENKQKFISQIMTNKNPVRSCEDIDESVLSYAEIKGLCIGDERIKEKMDLDIQVSKLRMLEGSHKSQQYRLEDKVLKYYPKEIAFAAERIAGLEKDIARWNLHSDDEFSMAISGKTFGKDEKKEAGEAIIEACKSVRGINISEKVGEYKGFDMLVTHHHITQKTEITLRGLGLKGDGITHPVELSESATGNITRIDNALNKIPERLALAKTNLEELHKNLDDAKMEMERPFPQAKELEEKSARLAELDIQLSMDNRQPSQQEEAEKEELQETAVSVADEPTDTPEQAAQVKTAEQAEAFVPKVDQRVVFHPDGGAVKLTGTVLSIEEKTVTIQAGSKKIPIFKDKGRFELAREPVSIEPSRKESSGFER